jgi:peroxiredoxin
MQTRLRIFAVFLASAVLAGCGGDTASTVPPDDPYAGYGGYGDYGDYYSGGEITFLDSAESNAAFDQKLSDIEFTALDGQTTTVRDHVGGRAAVLVVTRGNTKPICPYCSTQTSQYIRDYEEFRKRGAEVLLAYPVAALEDRKNLDAFLTNVRERLNDPERRVPFPILLDVKLSAVDRLGIRKDLSKPATYVVDREGTVRYAYVGSHWGDRPSTKAVLAQLDKIPFTGADTEASTNDVGVSRSSTPSPE